MYEFDNHKSKDFPLFREDSKFTDDTILTIATAGALMTDMGFASKYRAYGKKYPSSYGLRFDDWINEVITGPYDSFGNGSDIRVSAVACFDDKEHRVMELAKRSAEVADDHHEGINGAQATAMAILWARLGVPRDRIRHDSEAQFGHDLSN